MHNEQKPLTMIMTRAAEASIHAVSPESIVEAGASEEAVEVVFVSCATTEAMPSAANSSTLGVIILCTC